MTGVAVETSDPTRRGLTSHPRARRSPLADPSSHPEPPTAQSHMKDFLLLMHNDAVDAAIAQGFTPHIMKLRTSATPVWLLR